MSQTPPAEKRTHTTGRVLHRALGYDLLAWLLMLGTGERAEIVAEGERLLEFLGAGGRAIRLERLS